MAEEEVSSMHGGALGGLSFGTGAFPAATQAAFGLGGVGYGGAGGSATASPNVFAGIPVFPMGGGGGQQYTQPPEGEGNGALDPNMIMLVGGILLIGLLAAFLVMKKKK